MAQPAVSVAVGLVEASSDLRLGHLVGLERMEMGEGEEGKERMERREWMERMRKKGEVALEAM